MSEDIEVKGNPPKYTISGLPIVSIETAHGLAKDILDTSLDKQLIELKAQNPNVAEAIAQFAKQFKDRKTMEIAVQGMVAIYNLLDKQGEANRLQEEFK